MINMLQSLEMLERKFPYLKQLAIFLGFSISTYAAIKYLRQRKNMKLGKIKELYFYPFKSLKGISVDTLEFTEFGVRYKGLVDRQFALIEVPKGNEYVDIINFKLEPKLVLVNVDIANDKELTLSAEGMESIVLHEPSVNSNSVNVQLYDMKCEAKLCDPKVGAWFSKFLGYDKPLQVACLLKNAKESRRPIDFPPFKPYIDGSDKIAFHDSAHLLVVNEKSFRSFQKKFPFSQSQSILVFRPNVIMSDAEAWAEDSVKSDIAINNCRLTYFRPCDRCQGTCVDVESGELDPQRSTLLSLGKFRPKVLDSPTFGIVFMFRNFTNIHVGDTIYKA